MAGGVARGVVDDAVRVGVLASQKRGAARRAERRRGKRVQESRALARQPIDGWRLDERMAGKSEVIPAGVVDQDDEDVGTGRVCRRLLRNRAAPGQGKDDRQGEDPAQGHIERVRGDYSGAAE